MEVTIYKFNDLVKAYVDKKGKPDTYSAIFYSVEVARKFLESIGVKEYRVVIKDQD